MTAFLIRAGTNTNKNCLNFRICNKSIYLLNRICNTRLTQVTVLIKWVGSQPGLTQVDPTRLGALVSNNLSYFLVKSTAHVSIKFTHNSGICIFLKHNAYCVK